MIRNGIEYGIMNSAAEGLNIFRPANAVRLQRAADAGNTPLRNPELCLYEMSLTGIAEV